MKYDVSKVLWLRQEGKHYCYCVTFFWRNHNHPTTLISQMRIRITKLIISVMSTEINVKRRNYFGILWVTQNLKVNGCYGKKVIEYFSDLNTIYFEYSRTYCFLVQTNMMFQFIPNTIFAVISVYLLRISLL